MTSMIRIHDCLSRSSENSRDSLSSLNGFVGGDLSKAPYISPFGVLLRLTRLNQFAKKDIHAAFGFRLMSHEDPSQALAFSAKRMLNFSHSIGITPDARRGWQLADWIPFEGDVAAGWKDSWRTRVCLACAREGFHTWLFQLPWETHCPWHGTRLVDACPSCHRPLALGFSRKRPLLLCECGVDFFDRRKALMATPFSNRSRDRVLAECLDRAGALRSTQYLLPPVEQLHAGEALAALVGCDHAEPTPAPYRVHAFHTRHELVHGSFDSSLRGDLSTLGKQFEGKSSSIAEVPSNLVTPLRKIARSIATRVPPGSLVPAEARRLISNDMLATKAGAIRTDILYLPVQTGGDRSYLFTNGLPPSALTSISALIQKTSSWWADEESARLVHEALCSLLLRAYADGLRIVLSRYIPELYDHPRLTPWEHIPWVMVTMDAVGVSKIRIVWTRESLSGLLS